MHPAAGASSPAGLFLLLLLLADGAFIALHLLNEGSPSVDDRLYALHVDRSYSEAFQYLKLSWVAFLLAAVARTRRAPVLGAWSATFLYLACDDALQIHERGGAWVVRELGLPGAFGLRDQDMGELLVSGGAGIVLFGAIALLHRRSGDDAKHASRDLLLLTGLLVLFGVGFDMLHQLVNDTFLRAAFVVLEDGGELIAVSLLAAYAFRLHLAGGHVPAPLLRSRTAPTPSDGPLPSHD